MLTPAPQVWACKWTYDFFLYFPIVAYKKGYKTGFVDVASTQAIIRFVLYYCTLCVQYQYLIIFKHILTAAYSDLWVLIPVRQAEALESSVDEEQLESGVSRYVLETWRRMTDYTICDDWGEGSGLELHDKDCNQHQRGENHSNHYLYFYFFKWQSSKSPPTHPSPLVKNHQTRKYNFKPLFKHQGALLCPLSSDLKYFESIFCQYTS